MANRCRRRIAVRTGQGVLLLAVVVAVLWPSPIGAQMLTGALIGTVRDEQGGVLLGALVQVKSPALITRAISQLTDDTGQWRFPSLPPGVYELDISFRGFATYHEEGLRIGAGATIDRSMRLGLASQSASVVVEAAGSRVDVRDPGVSTRFGPEALASIPTRRVSMFDPLRATPGLSPTSPGSLTATTVSAFGSGTNENQYTIDGTNFTCPCNGIARSEPGIDFIEEIQIQSAGASAEYGNLQGAVINVITRQGGERLLFDTAYYGQPTTLTSQPIRLPYGSGERQSGYERARYRDSMTSLGGPVVRDRVWFFAGYQHLRDYDSQPGTDPAFPRTYEQDKVAGKLTWSLAPGWQLVQTVHYEHWVSPEQPTRAKPFETTLRRHASVPAITFAHLTNVRSARMVWDLRVGRFVHAREDDPSSGDRATPSRFDLVTGTTSGGPPTLGRLTLIRTTAKATVTRYQAGLWGVDHEWKTGVQIERGEGHGDGLIPTGVRFVDRDGQPFQSVSSAPSLTGGLFVTAGLFASDAITVDDRLTINVGLRFDHSRAISEDLKAVDADGRPTGHIVTGLGTLYTWNTFSPRLGATFVLTADGRAMLRGSYGRFRQGVLTGEYSAFHPGVTPVTTHAFDPSTGTYSREVRRVDSKLNLQLDPDLRGPQTDEYSVGVDREVMPRLSVAIAYVHKRGTDFIGWTEVRGQYHEDTQAIAGRLVPVFALESAPVDQQFRLTNPDDYGLTYHGLVLVVEKRWSHGWQASASYTRSRAQGLQASSGTTAGGAQSSTVALPTVPIGRDPNDLTNAWGRLPNDRPHMLRLTTSLAVPRTGFVFAANLNHVSGKPWAATAQIGLPQGDQRVLLEPRGSRQLASQSLLDVRLSRALNVQGRMRVELVLDVLNALNDTAEEDLVTDNVLSPNFGQPSVFMDPRRAMVGVRLKLGR